MSQLETILETLRDLLRSKIIGTTGYNNRMDHAQIELGAETLEKCERFPHIYIGFATERAIQVTLQTNYRVQFEVNIIGYVKSENDAYNQTINLYKDIFNAINEDPFLTSSGSELVLGTELDHDMSVIGEFGITVVSFRAKYHVLE